MDSGHMKWGELRSEILELVTVTLLAAVCPGCARACEAPNVQVGMPVVPPNLLIELVPCIDTRIAFSVIATLGPSSIPKKHSDNNVR